jgi:hypothetical protein
LTQEGQCGSQRFQLFVNHRATDFDHRKLLTVAAGELNWWGQSQVPE